MRGFADLLKKHVGFSTVEKRGFIFSVLILALVFSWASWGTVVFDFWVGAANYIIAVIIAIIVLGVHHFTQRIIGLRKGLKVTHTLFWQGGAVSTVLAIASQGSLTLLATTGTYVAALPLHRLGHKHAHPKISEYAYIAVAGPAANVILAGLVKAIQLATNLPSGIVDKFVIFSLLFAAWNIVPIPPLDGSRIIYYSRILYAFVVGAILGYIFLVQRLGVYDWLWALIIGTVTMLIFYFVVERPWQT